MKINNNDLKLLYSAYLIENTPLSRKNCPPSAEIIDLLRLKLSRKRRLKIINHLTECFFCYKEFQSLLEIQREESKLIAIANELAIRNHEDSSDKKEILEDPSLEKKESIPFFKRISWKFASVSLGIILILSTILVFFLFLNKTQKDYRSEYYPPLQLIEPVGKKLKKTVLKFRWVEIEGSEYYTVEIFDETLLSIWKSDKIYNNHFSPPEKLIDSLLKSKMYFWMLTAHFPDGQKIESRIELFVLTE